MPQRHAAAVGCSSAHARARAVVRDPPEPMNRDETVAAFPDFPWLAVDDRTSVERLFESRGWLVPGERVLNCCSAGQGNMNLTLLVKTTDRTLVVKQARPWVEKYDHIAAPWDRSIYEQRFYARVAQIPELAICSPSLVASDERARVLVLEHIPESNDLTSLYAGHQLSKDEVQALANYLVALHAATYSEDLADFPNREMRALNHEHIFRVPLADNGIDLDSYEAGLRRAADELRADSQYMTQVAQLGERYLDDGPCLVHGDFFPGSWLRNAERIWVIDPEFCFAGDPEVDLGCAIAHLSLSDQQGKIAEAFLDTYRDHGSAPHVDVSLLARYAAVEVMRRLIGVAQLPIAPTDGWRGSLLQCARDAMLEGSWEALWSRKQA